MKLLPADQIKAEKNKAAEDRMERIKKLREAENKAVKSFNDTKIRVETEINRLNDELSDYTQFVNARKKELTQEVSSLESRRADAMKPITEIRKEADVRLESVKIRETDADEREEVNAETQAKLAKRSELLTDQESEQNQRNKDLNVRLLRIQDEEKRLKQSQEKLSQGWIKFHKEVAEANNDLARLKKEVEDGKKANESVQLGFARTKQELHNYQIRLDDRAETLTRGFEELRIKQQKHG